MINKSNIFSSSVIDGINEENNSLNIYRERKDSKNSRNNNSSTISSVIFNNNRIKKSGNKKRVGFKEDISKEYIISNHKKNIEEVDDDGYDCDNRRNSLETQRDFDESETLLNDDEDDIDDDRKEKHCNNDNNDDIDDDKKEKHWINDNNDDDCHNNDSKSKNSQKNNKNNLNKKNNDCDFDEEEDYKSKKVYQSNIISVDNTVLLSKEKEEKEEEEAIINQLNRHNINNAIMTTNKSYSKITTEGKNFLKEKENNKEETDESLPNWNATPIAIKKQETNQHKKEVLKDNNDITSNNSNIFKHSNSSHSKSFSIENSKSCSIFSKDDTNSIKIGFINAFDSRKKKSEMPPTLIYTGREDRDREIDRNNIENPEKELTKNNYHYVSKWNTNTNLNDNFIPFDSQLNDHYAKPLISTRQVWLKGKNINANSNKDNNAKIKVTERDDINNNSIPEKPFDFCTNSKRLFPIGYHKKTMSQYSNIPSKVIPALKIKHQQLSKSQMKNKQNNTHNNQGNSHSTKINNIADHTTIHIFNNNEPDDDDIYENTHNTPLIMGKTNSIVFIEKIYKPSSSLTIIKPSKFIEQLLENRYSKIMLKLSLKEGSQNSTFVTKLYDFLSSILSTYNSNHSLVKCLYEKIPLMIRCRLNKSDLMFLHRDKETFSQRDRDSYTNEKDREIKNMIQRDMRTIQIIFENIMKEHYQKDDCFDLISSQKEFNNELDLIVKELD